MNSDLERMYRRLGYAGPLPTTQPALLERVSLSDASEEHPTEGQLPLDAQGLELLAERYRDDPEGVLERAHDLWDPEMTHAELGRAIAQAQAMVAAPREAVARQEAVELHERAATPTLPPEFFQELPGWDPNDPLLRIDPSSTKFETKADAAKWVLLAGAPLIGAVFSKKAPFKWHGDSPSGFVYERPSPSANNPLKVAMVSDFGTGLYHSNYIAKTLREHAYPYVLHGGDVYYAGRTSEFNENFKPQLDPLLALGTQVLTLNANHEMYASGKPYFRYIEERKRRHPEQLQEGSYFCLRFGKAFQIIGIDTAYFKNGRHDHGSLLRWLERVLVKGRQDGAVNVLFSSNEPYDYGSTSTKPLLRDLRSILVNRALVDLWFWGNTHHCALYDRSAELPFIGTCIGHGGYPYDRQTGGKPSAANVMFLETAARFPAFTNVRQDRGNNGYCEVSLFSDQRVQLKYIDWMRRERCKATLVPSAGSLRIDRLDV